MDKRLAHGQKFTQGYYLCASNTCVLDFLAIETRFSANFSPHHDLGPCAMAKTAMIKIKLVSSADTGFYYVTKKNSRTKTEKLVKNKYDPIAKKHVEFRESKIK